MVACVRRTPAPPIQMTPKMIEAGATAVREYLGDLGGLFSPMDLAVLVYSAMRTEREYEDVGR